MGGHRQSGDRRGRLPRGGSGWVEGKAPAGKGEGVSRRVPRGERLVRRGRARGGAQVRLRNLGRGVLRGGERDPPSVTQCRVVLSSADSSARSRSTRCLARPASCAPTCSWTRGPPSTRRSTSGKSRGASSWRSASSSPRPSPARRAIPLHHSLSLTGVALSSPRSSPTRRAARRRRSARGSTRCTSETPPTHLRHTSDTPPTHLRDSPPRPAQLESAPNIALLPPDDDVDVIFRRTRVLLARSPEIRPRLPEILRD